MKGLVSKKHKPILDDYINRLSALGYTSYYQVLNAKDYGIPQNRERVFTVSILNDDMNFVFPEKQQLDSLPINYVEDTVDEKYYLTEKNLKQYQRNFGSKGKQLNLLEPITTLTASMGTGGGNVPYFEFPPKQELELKLKDMLEDEVDEKYYLSEKMLNYCNSKHKYVSNKYKEFINTHGYIPEMFNPYNEKEITDIAPTQSTQCGSATSSATVLKNDNLRIRKLTPKECWRLMGFDDEDYERAATVNSNAQLYKQAGNSVVVNVIEAIFSQLLKKYQ